MIFIPLNTGIIKPRPNPTINECVVLLDASNHLIKDLKRVQASLNRASSSPDQALIDIKTEVDDMLDNAIALNRKLNTVYDNAIKNAMPFNSTVSGGIA